MKPKSKTLYLNGAPIGSASTWHDVVALLTRMLRRGVSLREALDHGSEGPDGFYVSLEQ